MPGGRSAGGPGQAGGELRVSETHVTGAGEQVNHSGPCVVNVDDQRRVMRRRLIAAGRGVPGRCRRRNGGERSVCDESRRQPGNPEASGTAQQPPPGCALRGWLAARAGYCFFIRHVPTSYAEDSNPSGSA